MDTKQKILNEALTLFSKKGYSDVYVGDIAKAVGIKAPSLYKHYKNKQEIFNSCIEVFSNRVDKIRQEMRLPDTKEADFFYETVSAEKLIDVATKLFLFYLQDDVVAKFRKMLIIERYNNPEINKLFEDLFINGVIKYEEKIFSNLIDLKIIKGEDPHIIALRFYTPIFYLLQKYDMHLDQVEDAKKELVLMVYEFCDTYKRS